MLRMLMHIYRTYPLSQGSANPESVRYWPMAVHWTASCSCHISFPLLSSTYVDRWHGPDKLQSS